MKKGHGNIFGVDGLHAFHPLYVVQNLAMPCIKITLCERIKKKKGKYSAVTHAVSLH